MPMLKLAAEFNISSVALKKRCKKLNIPTPGRGYWAKIEFGQSMPKPPLPDETVAETERATSSSHSMWPRDVSGFCERAQLLLNGLLAAQPNYRGLQSVENPAQPRVTVSKPLAEKAARLFHALLVSLESTGVFFQKNRRRSQSGYFEKGGERLYLTIEEPIGPIKMPRPSWRPPREEPLGKLQITLRAENYHRGWEESWLEDKDGSLRLIVEDITTTVTEYFQDLAKKRAAEAERQRLEHERWQKQEEIRKKTEHEKRLDDAARTRIEDLFFAAEWVRLYDLAKTFVDQCQTRWTATAPLTPEQEAWLRWARETIETWNPWKSGYPDPSRDGAFDRNHVPFGGPYPETREFPRPPTMPEPRPEPQNFLESPPSSPFPFWLRHLK